MHPNRFLNIWEPNRRGLAAPFVSDISLVLKYKEQMEFF